MCRPIYFDGFATTPMRPEAKAKLVEAIELFGNPNSEHREGRLAHEAIVFARYQIGNLIGCDTSEITFTSGATEANELACRLMFGQREVARPERRKIIISAVEHEALQRAVAPSVGAEYEVIICPMTADGTIDLKKLKELVDEKTLFVSIMSASNLTGIIQPIKEAAHLAHSVGALFHTDGTQAVGKIPIDVLDTDVDLMSFSAHKFGGPKGIGAVYISSITAPIFRTDQTDVYSIQQGTPAVPLIAAFGATAEACSESMDIESAQARQHLDVFIHSLKALGCDISQVGSTSSTVPGAAGLLFSDCDTDDLIARLCNTVCLSNASACAHGEMRASPLLTALHVPFDLHQNFFRVSMGWWIDDVKLKRGIAEIERVLKQKILATGDVNQ